MLQHDHYFKTVLAIALSSSNLSISGVGSVRTTKYEPEITKSDFLRERSGYSYGTRTATCICYSYGSQKISWDFSVIPDSRLSQLLYLPLEGLSESSECPFFEPDKFAYSLLTKRTTHSRHLELFCALLTHTSRE